MAVKTETQASELKINILTEELYQEALSNGEINDDEIYMTPSTDQTLSDLGVSASATELNQLKGVTRNIQEQIDENSKIKISGHDVADLHVWRRRFHDPSLPFCGSRTEWCSIVTNTDTSLSYSDTISCLENGVFLVDPITITVSSEDDPVLDKIKGKYIYSSSHNAGFVSYVDRNAVFVKEVIDSDWLISTTGYIISADTDFVDEFDYVTSIRADEYTYPGKSYSSYEYEEHSDGCYYQYCGRLGSLLKLNIDGDIKSISSSTDQTITLDVENNGTEYRLSPYGGTRTLTINLSIAHSELANTDRARYTIVFVSESMATTMTDNVGIYFTGDNTSNGVFTPEAYATYELKIWWNGISWQGSVRASNVLAST